MEEQSSTTCSGKETYEEVLIENERLRGENERLREENERLRDENQRYKEKENEKRQSEEAKRSERNSVIEIDSDDLSAENVREQFIRFFETVEFTLPGELGIDRLQLWQCFCKVFQKTFDCCRDEFMNILVDPLYSLTELSKEEKASGRTDYSRHEELAAVRTAYSCLLNHSLSKLGSVHQYVVDEVKKAITTDRSTDEAILSQLDEQVLKAIEICWRMQMLPDGTPMFVCQPKLFNENWHDKHRKSWHEESDELVYYRPVLMYGAGGTVAHKGFIGTSQSDSGECPSFDEECHTESTPLVKQKAQSHSQRRRRRVPFNTDAVERESVIAERCYSFADRDFLMSLILSILSLTCTPWSLLCTVPAMVLSVFACRAERRGKNDLAHKRRHCAFICNVFGVVSMTCTLGITLLMVVTLHSNQTDNIINY